MAVLRVEGFLTSGHIFLSDVAPETDTQIMGEVRDGDTKRLALLFERHHVALYNYFVRLSGKRTLSEDMTQEVFLRILKYRQTYRGDGDFLPWMYHIARNVQIDYGKRWKKESVSDIEEHDQPDDSPGAQIMMEQRQDISLLRTALARLPADKREVLVLSRFHDLQYKSIAEILGCSIEAVKVRAHRAMNELRRTYCELSGDQQR